VSKIVQRTFAITTLQKMHLKKLTDEGENVSRICRIGLELVFRKMEEGKSVKDIIKDTRRDPSKVLHEELTQMIKTWHRGD